jgi:hypothetical protein
MKRMILFVGLIAHAHAATYRVCWSVQQPPAVRCGDPVSKKAADSFVAQARRDFPNLNYYVDVQAKSIDWNRARWAGAAAALGAGIFDARTTTQLIAAGGAEQNPIYGSHPTAARLYGTNVGTVLGAWILTDWLRRRRPDASRTLDRNMFFSELGATAVHVGAGVYNQASMDRQRSLRQK